MAIVAAKYATAVVAAFANQLQHQINPANPAINYDPNPGKGKKIAEAREKAKAKGVAQQEKERAHREAESRLGAKTTDVVFDDGGSVMVRGQHVGSWQQRGDYFVFFDREGKEQAQRKRQRDLRKAAAFLYEGPDREPKETRQARRQRERFQRKSFGAALKRQAMRDEEPGGSATVR